MKFDGREKFEIRARQFSAVSKNDFLRTGLSGKEIRRRGRK